MERLTVKFPNGYWLKLPSGKDEKAQEEFVNKLSDKLGEYEDLEEQGLLLRLPCEVGTSVYMVAQDCDGHILNCMRVFCEGCQYLYSFVEENNFEAYMLEDIGKTVFLTKAEAEQKLKEMESD